MIKILDKQPNVDMFDYPKDIIHAYESCIKVVDIDDMLMRYCMYEEDLPLKERQKEFSEYLLEQIGEK